MHLFSRVRERFAGHPCGVPPPSGRLPLPLQKPPRGGVNRPPKGRGRAAPLSGRWPPLRPPWGTPTGFPRPFWPAPPPVSVRQWKGLASEARRGGTPRRGVGKKSKLWRRLRPQAASGGNVGKVGQSVGRGGGSRWAAPGLSTGCPCLCPRTGEAAHRSRSDLHISTARGSNSAPSGGWTESRSRFPQH